MPEPSPSTPPTAATPKQPSRMGTWLRYRSWTVIVSLFLILLGLGNIYPFFWMMGTSLKSTPEAARHRENPLPQTKYYITPTGRAALPADYSRSQLSLLADLQTREYLLAQSDQPGPRPRIWPLRHAGLNSLPEAEARQEIEQLRDAGLIVSAPPYREYSLSDQAREQPLDGTIDESQRDLLERMITIEQETPGTVATITDQRFAQEGNLSLQSAEQVLATLTAEGWLMARPPVPAYWLAPDAFGEIANGLNARQLVMLRALADEDDSLRERVDTFVAYRMTLIEYGDSVGLDPEQEVLSEELGEMLEGNLLQSSPFLWANYLIVFKDMRFYVNLITTVLLTLAVVLIVVYTTSMLGYALTRIKFPGKGALLLLLLIGAIAPREAVIIPIFRTLQAAGALEGLWGIVLWMSGVGIGNALLMAGFFLTLPKEVEEAATVDGAGPFRIFFDVAMPMARPIVVTVGLFAFLSAWNDFLIPFILTQASPDMQPLAVAVYSFQQGRTGYWGLTNAAAAIMIIPVIIIFLGLQRHIVKSIAVGAVKG